MQRHSIFSMVKSMIKSSVAMFFILGSLLSACGGKFSAGSQASEVRPPATSDPMTARDQRRWESETGLDRPLLETKVERDTFLEDVTEQAPTHSEEQLADDAEKQFEKKNKSADEAGNVHQNSNRKVPPPETQVPEQDPKKTPKAKPQPQPKVEPKPEPKPEPEPKSSVPVGSLCEGINVTSANGEVDLSALYNDDTQLPTSMPSSDLANARSQIKKNKFVCILLPIAIRMNEEVFKQRIEVLRLQAKQKKNISLSKEDEIWITDIKTAYRLTPKSSFEEVLKRIDIIPLPLLLAQAALESGWGTSRATRELKNLFGLHAGKGQACRRGFDSHSACVRIFTSVGQGVSEYIRLLNTGTYYPKFRDKRAQMRASKEALDSIKLLRTLGSYNETPSKYIQNVREIMTKSNKLTQFVFNEEIVKAL